MNNNFPLRELAACDLLNLKSSDSLWATVKFLQKAILIVKAEMAPSDLLE